MQSLAPERLRETPVRVSPTMVQLATDAIRTARTAVRPLKIERALRARCIENLHKDVGAPRPGARRLAANMGRSVQSERSGHRSMFARAQTITRSLAKPGGIPPIPGQGHVRAVVLVPSSDGYCLSPAADLDFRSDGFTLHILPRRSP